MPIPRLSGVCLQSGGLDARDGADLIIVGRVAADADGAEQAAVALDQHAAGHRHQTALRHRIHGADEIGLFLGALEQRPRSHAQRKRAIGLAMRNLGPHQAGAILRRRDLHAAAGIQNGDDQRLQFLLDAFGERGIENLAGDFEGEFSHDGFLM